MQKHIDPLLGKQRYAQLQALGNEEYLELTPDERRANHFLATSGAALSVALLGGYSSSVLLPIAGGIALLGLWQFYVLVYYEWQKKRRVGAISRDDK